MEDEKRILISVFGESSSDSEDEEQQHWHSIQNQNPFWERVKEINGLWLCRNFISPEEQSSLLSAINHEGWFTEASHNQAMRFGDLPKWAVKLSELIHDALCSDFSCESCESLISCAQHEEEECPLPLNLLWRQPLFDQLIVNVYQPGEGICRHVDLMRFEDGIAIVSLESACVMHFTRFIEGGSGSGSEAGKEEEGSPLNKIPLYLTPGSLVLMSGEARYCWMHEINRKPGFQVWEGQAIHQQKRTSVTLRKLCVTK